MSQSYEDRRKILNQVEYAKDYLLRGGTLLEDDDKIQATLQIQEVLLEDNDMLISQLSNLATQGMIDTFRQNTLMINPWNDIDTYSYEEKLYKNEMYAQEQLKLI